MHRFLIGLFLFSQFSFPIHAQVGVASDPEAEELLSDISNQAKNYLNISATYASTLIDLQADMRIEQAGDVLIEGDRYRLNLGDYTIISDGRTVWTLETDMGECYIDDAEEISDDGMDPSKMFTIWESGFQKTWKGEVDLDGQELVRIDLYPEDKSASYHTIQLWIDEGRRQMVQLLVKGRDGSDVRYLVTRFETDLKLPENSFSFDPAAHPDVQLIDNRL
jgi:outer membrane lipoprotein-sorting protein